MTQDIAQPEGGESNNGQTPEVNKRTDLDSLPQDVQDYIKELRREARKSNDAKKEADRIALEQSAKKLADDQQWEALAKQTQLERDALKPRAERLDAMEAFLTESAQKRIAALPKQWQQAVPEYDDPLKTLAWLDANANLYSRPQVPSTGAGEQGDAGKRAVELTPEQRAMAARLRIPEDKYAAQLRKEQSKRS